MRNRLLIPVALFLIAAPFLSANAVLVGYRYEGEVYYSDTPGVNLGDAISGEFYYESTVPDSDALPESGRYEQTAIPLARMRYSIGSLNTDMKVTDVYVTNNSSGFDGVYIYGLNPLADGAVLGLVGFDTALGDDSLPITIAFADLSENPYFDIYRNLNEPLGRFAGSITSLERITVSAVPLPAAVWLFISGIAGLLSVAARKSRAQVTI